MNDARSRSTEGDRSPGSERLHKLLAAAGIASRRECEELILEGRVEVDGRVVTELGMRVDPQSQEVRLDGEKIRVGKRLYFAFYKPTGVLCTSEDPAGRSRVIDWIPTTTRIFTVGRLDQSSEGLILVTNDGELAQKLTHPKFGVEKTYDVIVAGDAHWESVKVLLDGVRLAEGWAKVKSLEIRKRMKDKTQLRIVLDEGKNREIRRLLARIGHKVLKLTRIAIGRLSLGVLQSGEHRVLTASEVKGLLALASGSEKGPRRASRGDSSAMRGKTNGPGTRASGRGVADRPSRGKPTGRPAAPGRPARAVDRRGAEERSQGQRPERRVRGSASPQRENTGTGNAKREAKGSRPDPRARAVRWGERPAVPPTGRRNKEDSMESREPASNRGPRPERRSSRPPFSLPPRTRAPHDATPDSTGEENPDNFTIIRRRKSGANAPSSRPPVSSNRPPRFEADASESRSSSSRSGRPMRSKPAEDRSGQDSDGARRERRGPAPRGSSSRGPSSRGAAGRGPASRGPAGRRPAPGSGERNTERHSGPPRRGSASGPERPKDSGTIRNSSTRPEGQRRGKKMAGKVKLRRKRSSD